MESKSLNRLAEKGLQAAGDTFRLQILEAARQFKSGWMDLGRLLFQVQRDHAYRRWGYPSFEAYCGQEIGIRRATAVKLLRSYYFLEQEEPAVLQQAERASSNGPRKIPSVESVALLSRVKKSEHVSPQDYADIRHTALSGEDPARVREKVRYVLRNSQSAAQKSQDVLTRRKRIFQVLGQLRALVKDTPQAPRAILKELDAIEHELSEALK